MASVLSIQVGSIAPLGPEQVPSGFVKRPVNGPVLARTLGLKGDAQADLSVHGGPDKAVYFYASEHYARWLADVPRHAPKLTPGAFGENVTTIGLDENNVSIGDVFSIGAATFQVSQPRQPCFKLGLHFGDNAIGRIMIQSDRSGWYARVIQSGQLQAGDEIRIQRRPSPAWTIARFNRLILRREATIEDLMELAKVEGLSENWRTEIAEAISGQQG